MIEAVRRTTKTLVSHLSLDHIGDHEEANRRDISLHNKKSVPVHESTVDVGEREPEPLRPFKASTPSERYSRVIVGPSAFSEHFAHPFSKWNVPKVRNFKD